MKGLKKILCLFLMLTFCWSFSACSKGEEKQPETNTPPIEQSPETGSGDEGENDEPEVYVPLELNDLLDIGARAIGNFVYNLNADLNDSDEFDDNIAARQALFLGASEMLSGIREFDNISYETNYKGELLDAEEGELERVAKFYLEHWEEDDNGYSKADIKLILSYKNLDVLYTYDYYNFVIETNQKHNAYSLRLAVEESELSGSYNSKAKFTILELDGEIKTKSTVKYDVIRFERNKQLSSYTASTINNSNIINYTRSQFDGTEKTYMNENEGSEFLRNPDTQAHNLVVLNASEMGQDFNLLQKALAIRSISGLSNAIISCVK